MIEFLGLRNMRLALSDLVVVVVVDGSREAAQDLKQKLKVFVRVMCCSDLEHVPESAVENDSVHLACVALAENSNAVVPAAAGVEDEVLLDLALGNK